MRYCREDVDRNERFDCGILTPMLLLSKRPKLSSCELFCRWYFLFEFCAVCYNVPCVSVSVSIEDLSVSRNIVACVCCVEHVGIPLNPAWYDVVEFLVVCIENSEQCISAVQGVVPFIRVCISWRMLPIRYRRSINLLLEMLVFCGKTLHVAVNLRNMLFLFAPYQQ